MGALEIIKGIIGTAAPIAANLVVPGSGSIVSGLINGVLRDKAPQMTSKSMEEKAAYINSNPELLAALKTRAMDLEATIAQEKTKNAADVNQTIRAELQDGRWYQRAWRPFNGFMFPVVLILNYVVLPLYLAPKFVACPGIPEWALVTWAGILGVAVHGRNQEKKAQAGIPAVAGGLLTKLKGILK